MDESLYKHHELATLLDRYKSIAVPYSPNLFSASRGENRLKEFYEVRDLSSFGNFSKGEVGALGAIIEYIELTQKGNKPYISVPLRYEQKNFMVIDGATRKNLEITESLSGNKKTSLLSVINHTMTPLGARLLNSYLGNPLCYASGINERLNMVEFFVGRGHLRKELRLLLQKIPDMERSVSRISLNRGGPRDLANIYVALFEVMKIAELLECANAPIPSGIINIKRKLNPHTDVSQELHAALAKESLPVLTRDGGFIDTEYHPKIKELRMLQQNGADSLQKLKEHYQQETGVSSLKVTKNNVIGYYIEVPASQAKKMDLQRFIHKQSMVNALRYTTPELQQLEEDIVTASDKILHLELELYNQLVEKVIACADTLSLTSQGLAELDVMVALAELAVEQNYVKPVMDESHAFRIDKGRHPVVEQNIMGELEHDFIPNNCDLSEHSKIWLLTGPNMAGKSTFLRQNALIVILAQIGSYVPAEHAHIGTVDRLFSRIGASDDLARGRSTFMVEMTETATILNQSTDKSLVILDEIGRGTATYDGLAIAWSVLEYLHNTITCRGLFATHYHELTRLAEELPHLASYTVDVKEWGEKIIFLHQVVKGAAEKSYGIHVGKLAGLPPRVIKRATQILGQISHNAPNQSQDLPLFSSMAEEDNGALNVGGSQVEDKLQAVDIDALSPKDALDLLYELRELL